MYMKRVFADRSLGYDPEQEFEKPELRDSLSALPKLPEGEPQPNEPKPAPNPAAPANRTSGEELFE